MTFPNFIWWSSSSEEMMIHQFQQLKFPACCMLYSACDASKFQNLELGVNCVIFWMIALTVSRSQFNSTSQNLSKSSNMEFFQFCQIRLSPMFVGNWFENWLKTDWIKKSDWKLIAIAWLILTAVACWIKIENGFKYFHTYGHLFQRLT